MIGRHAAGTDYCYKISRLFLLSDFVVCEVDFRF